MSENGKRLRELNATQLEKEKRRSARRESENRATEIASLETELAEAIKAAQASNMDTTAMTRVSILRRKLREAKQAKSFQENVTQ